MASIDRSLVAKLPLFAGSVRPDALDDVLREARAVRHAEEQQRVRAGRGGAFLLRAAERPCPRQPRPRRPASRWLCAMSSPGETFGVAMAIGLDALSSDGDRSGRQCRAGRGRRRPGRGWSRSIRRWRPIRCRRSASRLQETHTRVIEMSTEQVERRVAHALLRLIQQAGRKVAERHRDRLSRSAGRTSPR